MIKGYEFDVDTNGKEVDEDYLINILSESLKLKGIDLVGFSWQANWENMSDYERNIQVY